LRGQRWQGKGRRVVIWGVGGGGVNRSEKNKRPRVRVQYGIAQGGKRRWAGGMIETVVKPPVT